MSLTHCRSGFAAVTERSMIVLLVRLDTLKATIESRDWDAVEFQFDRVLSQAQKMAGTRDRGGTNEHERSQG